MQLAQYLQMQYADVIYRYDLAADIRMTIGQARRNKALHPTRGYPDLFIAEPRGNKGGLYLELKAAPITLKNGQISSNPHIQEQVTMLARLRAKGYVAEFVVGFDQARSVIDQYLLHGTVG